jgi:hypothetical protein
MNKTKLIPGTVSKILWHFTGGPEWDNNLQKQKSKPKAKYKAYKNLCSILYEKEIKLGNYKEFVEGRPGQLITVPNKTKGTMNVKIEPNFTQKIESKKVCCLADIPIQHLSYHAYRYGNFAIGYHRHSVIKSKLNPVLYTLSDNDIINDFVTTLHSIATSNKNLANIYDILNAFLNDLDSLNDKHVADFKIKHLNYLKENLGNLFLKLEDSNEILNSFLAYIKSFNIDEFNTIYCEREWRSLSSYIFEYKDIAMIVIPKGNNNASKNYFSDFITKKVTKLGIPREIPIIPWEDLLEY